jgi:periplasmic protein TonB
MFDTALIESNKRKLARKTNWYFTGPISISVHLITIAFILFSYVWQIEDVPEPPMQVVFISAPPPPPPPPPPPKAKPKAPEVKPKLDAKVEPPKVNSPVQPVDVPQDLPPPKSSSEADTSEGEEGGQEGGVEGGVAGGVAGGVLGGTKGDEETPIRITPDMQAPELLKRVEPEYPEIARKARMGGMVILEAILTGNGDVEDVRVLKSAGNSMLDESAVRAVRQWKYKPALLNGKPVKVYLTVTVMFKLNN